jgi:WD40 repeat protein
MKYMLIIPLNSLSLHPQTPLWSLDGHTAAVKAIEYVPFWGLGSNYLATGGGSGDGTIRVWNLNTGSEVVRMETDSQARIYISV